MHLHFCCFSQNLFVHCDALVKTCNYIKGQSESIVTTEVCRCDHHHQDFQALTSMSAHAITEMTLLKVKEPIWCTDNNIHFLLKEAWDFGLCGIKTFVKHMPTHTQSVPRHRRPNCGEIRATHAARVFCFGEERRKLSPQGEVLRQQLNSQQGKAGTWQCTGTAVISEWSHLSLTACELFGACVPRKPL